MAAHILFVCTANICRSPMAQLLLDARMPVGAGFTTSSAGTRALVGQPMDATSALVLRELGGDPDRHVARQMSEGILGAADLVLTATTAHRAEIVRELPALMRRTFTLREFVRLGAGLPPTGRPRIEQALRPLVLDVAAQRGIVGPAPSSDEIGDPFGAPLPVVRACGDQISEAIDALMHVLVAEGDASPS